MCKLTQIDKKNNFKKLFLLTNFNYLSAKFNFKEL